MSVNRLLLYNGTETIDSEADYGIVVLDMNDQDQREVQNISSQTWYDESGEDVFYPTTITYKAYDCDVTLGVKDDGTQSARDIKNDFLDAIVGKELAIEQECINAQMCGCYVSKVEDDEWGDGFLTFKVTFRVTKPTTAMVIPTSDPVYSNPVVNIEYPADTASANGGTYYPRTRTFTQTKTTTYPNGTTKVETITSGGTWTFTLQQSPTTAGVTIDSTTGAVTFPKNSSGKSVTAHIIASVTANGKTGSTGTSGSVDITQEYSTNTPYYVGQMTATSSAFSSMDASTLVSNASSHDDSTNATTVTSWIYYIMLPSDCNFVSLKYTSGGITSTLSTSDFNCSHADITYNSVKYKVYALRTSPNSIVYNLTVSW